MAAAQTYKNIQDRVMDTLSKSDTTTRNRVKNWINMGYQDFIAREQWPFRESAINLSLVAGTQEYNLASNITDIESRNITAVTIQDSNPAQLGYMPYEQLRTAFPDFDYGTASVPMYWYLKGRSSGYNIGFYPVPSTNLTVEVDYHKGVTELSSDSDEPIIPIAYREALMHYALSLEHDYNTDGDLATKSMNRYEQIVTLARTNLLAQPFDVGAFRMRGPADFRNWTGLNGEIR